jgi:hypothetical protein
MYKVKDESGNIVSGLLKDDRGSIVVEKNLEYSRHLKTKQQAETINKLTKEVDELKYIVQDLINIHKERNK